MTRLIRRFLCLTLAALMLAALLPPSVMRSTAKAASAHGIVTLDGVNFRVGPSMKDKQLFRLSKGTIWEVVTSRFTANGYDWYQIKAKDPENGKESIGYIRGDCFRMLTDSEESAYNKGQGVNPNNGGSNNGGNSNNNNNNATGDILGYVMTIKGSVNIRASIGGTSLTQVGIYKTFPYLLSPVKRGGYTWYFVQVNSSLKGYIRGDCVKLASGSGESGNSNSNNNNNNNNNSNSGNSGGTDYTTPSGYVRTTIDDVNVRKGVWGDLVTVVRKAGTAFPYYGEPTVSGSTKWYFIKGDSFGYAYIHGGFVTATSNGNSGNNNNNNNNNNNSGNQTPDGSKNEASYTTLRYGSSGTAVLNLVRELKRQGYFSGAETDKYNSVVENAVRNFQKAKGLKVDGIAGNDTQHKLYNTVPIGSGNRSDLSFTKYPVEKIDWYTGGINELWPRGSNFKIYDVDTGLVWWAHRWAGGLHVDAEPLTAADTAVICKMYGVSDSSQITEKNHWQRRPCLVTIGTRTFACSLYGVPHNYPDGDTISTNNFKGQVCIHFTNSKTHDSKKVDSNHQKAIDNAYNYYYGNYTPKGLP